LGKKKEKDFNTRAIKSSTGEKPPPNGARTQLFSTIVSVVALQWDCSSQGLHFLKHGCFFPDATAGSPSS